MIDWFQGRIGYDSRHLKCNYISETTPDGETVWQSEKKLQAVGSYSTSVQVGKGSATKHMEKMATRFNRAYAQDCLYVSGNPVKFLQGHNAFGPSVKDMVSIVHAMVDALPKDIRPIDILPDQLPSFDVGRVDISVMINLGSDRIVHEYLNHIEGKTRSRHGRPLVSGDTVYYGKHSKRWTVKFYCKFCEMKEHPPVIPGWKDMFLPYLEGQLRGELTLRTLEYRQIQPWVGDLEEPEEFLSEHLAWKYFEKIEGLKMLTNASEKKETKLPGPMELTLMKWQAGVDVKRILPQNTFYRHRRLLMSQLGLDISLPYIKSEAQENVLDLEYLKAREIKVEDLPENLKQMLFQPRMDFESETYLNED